MSVVRISKKHRMVISEEIRKSVPIEVGQEVLQLSLGDSILVIPLPKDPDIILKRYLGKFKFSRKLREAAERQMVKAAARA